MVRATEGQDTMTDPSPLTLDATHEDQLYELWHDPDNTEIAFTGRVLGGASSQYDDSVLRWMEITIYKTITGKYIVSTIGCSDVYHTMEGHAKSDGSTCSSGLPTTLAECQGNDITIKPCPLCNPDRAIRDANAYIRLEVDKSNVFVCNTPVGVRDSLLATDSSGVKYLTKLAKAALRNAAENEPALWDRSSRRIEV